MAGHSKWNNIKHKKGAEDAKRGKLFGQLSKQIRIAVKEGSSDDPKTNSKLRLALDKAKEANMPKDNIKRAIERGLGKTSSGATIQEIVYEGFGPGGVAMLVVGLTDNPNRTSADLKYAFSRAGSSLGSPGSAMYLFERKGSEFEPTMEVPLEESDQKKLLQLVDNLRELEDVEDIFYAASLPEDNAE